MSDPHAEPTADLPPGAIHARAARRDEALLAEARMEQPGSVIGQYRLVQLLGEGGFGSVFMADQERPVQRTVALKIIKLGMDTRQVVARFEQERQALALMDHPNIARVYDAGATQSGRPYFVMELVKGQPISEYCQRNELSIEGRLALFIQVCQAVQHAHTKGIIHRDIKPSNILISTQDGHPVAKVIDFGIAKATQSRLTDRTLHTEQRQVIGTIEYMSPEQAEGSLDIDARTDVYALGVVLYELLTGSTPHSGDELRSKDSVEAQRIIREVDPPRPSQRLSVTLRSTASTPAGRPQGRRTRSGLTSELDWITLRALEKDRTRRYETASAFADDIRRYLTGEPVQAAPPSTAYRLRKFLRRHRALAAAVGLVSAALLLGIVGTTAGLVSANRQRALATERLAEAEATVKFLDDMLGAADPMAKGKDVTVRSLLEEASKSIGTQYRDRPLVAARLNATMARTYLGLGLFEPAERHARDAYETRLKLLGRDDEQTCRALNVLASVLVRTEQSAKAEPVLISAAADHTRLFGRTHPITLQTLDALGMLYQSQNRDAETATIAAEVLAARRVSPGPSDPDTVSAMVMLATAYAGLGRVEESDGLFEEAIASRARELGEDHPLTLGMRANFAWALYWTATSVEGRSSEWVNERIERSRVINERMLEDRARVLGEDHPDTLASMNNLAIVYNKLRRFDKCDELNRRGLETSIRVLGPEHPDTIVSIANYGKFLRDQKRFEESAEYLERAVRLSRKVLPPDNQGLAFALGWYGGALESLGRRAEAISMLTEAHGIISKLHGAGSPIARDMAGNLARIYRALDESEPGRGHDQRATEWLAKSKAEAQAAPAKP
ncbi:MAG: tetratricopeptide repeat protein [Phycisphaerales bacterium]|nr:tetratricopeptide repeat protein [Phycisphaerales bacterium]